MDLFSRKSRTLPLTEQLMNRAAAVRFMMMDALTIRADGPGEFGADAWSHEVAALYHPETWQGFDGAQAESLDMVGGLQYPLQIILDDGTEVVYDMDEGSARKMMALMKQRLGPGVQHIPLQKRRKSPLAQNGYMVRGQDHFLRLYDNCVHIHKVTPAGVPGDCTMLARLVAGVQQVAARELIIPYRDVRQVLLRLSTLSAGPLLTILRKSSPLDSAATPSDMNDRLDCWAFVQGEDASAEAIAQHIRSRITAD